MKQMLSLFFLFSFVLSSFANNPCLAPNSINGLHNVIFSPNGSRFAISAGRCIFQFNNKTGNEISHFIAPTEIYSIAYSHDNQTIASGDANSEVTLWQSDSGIKEANLPDYSKGKNAITSVNFSPNEKTLVDIMCGDIRAWSVGKKSLPVHLPQNTRACANTSTISPDGQWLAVGYWGNYTRIYNLKTKKLAYTLDSYVGNPNLRPNSFQAIEAIKFIPNSDRVLLATDRGTIEEWNFKTNQKIKTIQISKIGVSSMALGPNGKVLYVPAPHGVSVWEVDTGKKIAEYTDPHLIPDSVKSLALSPNGHTLVSGAFNGTALMWDTATGKLMEKIDVLPNKNISL